MASTPVSRWPVLMCASLAMSSLTVSDHLVGDLHMSADQRETGVDAMVRLVLDALLR